MDKHKAERRIRNVNKMLRMSRVEHGAYFSLLVIAGIAAAKLFSGKFMEWLLFGAWISYPIVCAMAYAFTPWQKNTMRKKAAKLLAQHPELSLEEPEDERMGKWSYSAVSLWVLFLGMHFTLGAAVKQQMLQQGASQENSRFYVVPQE